MNAKLSARICATALVVLTPAAMAQLVIQDNFTGASFDIQLAVVQWRLPDRRQ